MRRKEHLRDCVENLLRLHLPAGELEFRVLKFMDEKRSRIILSKMGPEERDRYRDEEYEKLLEIFLDYATTNLRQEKAARILNSVRDEIQNQENQVEKRFRSYDSRVKISKTDFPQGY